MRRRGLLPCALVLIVSLLVSHARADAGADAAQRAVARELGTAGMEAYFKHDYARAADQLDRAYRLFATPTLGLWSARALVQIGQWVRAAERLREAQFTSAAVGDGAAQRRAQTEAGAELAALAPRIPRLTIHVVDAPVSDVVVTIDEHPLEPDMLGIARPIDPGPHVISGVSGAQRVEVKVTLAENDAQVARVVFEKPVAAIAAPVAPPPAAAEVAVAPAASQAEETESSPLRHAAIVSLSVGSMGLATSLVAMLLARDRLHACERSDGELWCPDNEADAFEDLWTISTVSFYGGTALAVSGALMWLLDGKANKPKNTPSVRLLPTPLGAELSGRF